VEILRGKQRAARNNDVDIIEILYYESPNVYHVTNEANSISLGALRTTYGRFWRA